MGHLRAAVYPALRENWGSAILAICGPCCRKSPAAAGRLLALTRFMPSIRRTRRAPAYSPSSRRWLNVIYIDVNAVEDFQRSEEAQAWWQSPATQQALQAARETDDVDYTAVTTLKMTALRMAWKQFSRREDEQMTAFREFVLREGESLYWQAAFDALHARQVQQDPLRWGWPAGRRPFRISTARR